MAMLIRPVEDAVNCNVPALSSGTLPAAAGSIAALRVSTGGRKLLPVLRLVGAYPRPART